MVVSTTQKPVVHFKAYPSAIPGFCVRAPSTPGACADHFRCCCYWIGIQWHQLPRNALLHAVKARSRSIGCRSGTGSDVSISSVEPAQGITTPTVHGAWQLLSYEVEEQANGETFAPMGENPTGYVIFTAEGRLSFVLSAEDRQPGNNADERSALLSSMIAYTGIYRLEGDRWITHVDVAWNPEWVGTEQTRFFAIDGDLLTVHTPWRVMPNWPDKGLTRSIVRFQRCR